MTREKVRKALHKWRTFKWHCVFVVNNEICCYCCCNLDHPARSEILCKLCKKHTKFLFRMGIPKSLFHPPYQMTFYYVLHLFSLLHISRPRNKTFYSLDERKFLPRREKGKARVPPHITTNYHTPPLPPKLPSIHSHSRRSRSFSFVSIRIYADSFKSLIQIKRNLAYFECFSLEKFPSDFDSSSLRFVSVCESMLPQPIEQTFRRLLPKQGKPIVV